MGTPKLIIHSDVLFILPSLKFIYINV